MVRHAAEPTTTLKDAHGASSPITTETTTLTDDDVAVAVAATETCRPEHGFHAFDALYCALANARPIKPLFPDDK